MSAPERSGDYVPISHLNALVYCPRRYVYEYVQAEMLINAHVVEGRLRHQGVDSGGTVWAAAGLQERRVYVWSERLAIAGFIDLVEQQGGAIYPVEYKKGRVDRGMGDAIQLCAQAICLEERMGISIPQGELFSFATRQRLVVPFTPALRADVEQVVVQAHQLAAAQALPPPISERNKCRDCSLQPLCLPDEVRALQGGSATTNNHDRTTNPV
jgi:CRISPR-associated exonuclease Cas4